MTIWQLTKEDRERRLLDSFKKGDVVRQNSRHPGEWLVKSATHPNVWYRVRVGAKKGGESCGCQGFIHYGVCRHLVRVSWEIHQFQLKARREAKLNGARQTMPAMPQVAA